MKISAVRRFRFCAGHRLAGHEGPCRNLHGHNYVVYLHVSAAQLDSLGRVVDFSVLEETFGNWIDANWDHAFLIAEGDSEALTALRFIPDQKIFELPYSPTAENLARYLVEFVAPKLLRSYELSVDKIVLWETENCFVEVVP